MNKQILFAALGGAFAIGVASTASAAGSTLTVTSAGVYDYSTVSLSGTIPGAGAYPGSSLAGPIVLQGVNGSGQAFDDIVFCVDLFHTIPVGLGYQAGVNYSFTAAPLQYDSSTASGSGNTLSVQTISNISALANLGSTYYKIGGASATDQETAIQSAIWHDEYGVTISGFADTTAENLYNTYISENFPTANAVAIYGSQQGQVVGGFIGSDSTGISAVPEPATWAMMILGLGVVGAAARSRRRAGAVLA